jgi:hypothetical protein
MRKGKQKRKDCVQALATKFQEKLRFYELSVLQKTYCARTYFDVKMMVFVSFEPNTCLTF